jgi:hypothetical protein
MLAAVLSFHSLLKKRTSSTLPLRSTKKEAKSLVLLQVNCRSIYNKAVEFWNLVDTYNPDIIGME